MASWKPPLFADTAPHGWHLTLYGIFVSFRGPARSCWDHLVVCSWVPLRHWRHICFWSRGQLYMLHQESIHHRFHRQTLLQHQLGTWLHTVYVSLSWEKGLSQLDWLRSCNVLQHHYLEQTRKTNYTVESWLVEQGGGRSPLGKIQAASEQCLQLYG